MDNMPFKKSMPVGRQVRNFSIFLLITVLVHLAIAKSGIFWKALDNNRGILSDKVWQLLETDYLYKDKIDSKKRYYGAIEGEVASLGDRYTVFLPPMDNKMSRENLAGEFGGVGVSLGYKDGVLAVMSPLAKTPAAKAGIKANDLIIRIKDGKAGVDVDTVEISISEAVELIRGKIGTKVILSIMRQGEKEILDVELVRDNIVVASVEIENYEKNGKKISWIKMHKFSDRLYEEWDEMVENVLKNGSDMIVLDLRNNPGGYLDGSVVIASDFLKSGVVVGQKTAGKIKDYPVINNMGRLVEKEMVVLINEGSASAAEILAGALRHHLGVKILGQTSFGKGTVQNTTDFADGSGLHVTIAKWLLPNGEEIDGKGVKPDFEIEWEYDDLKDSQMVFDYISKLD